MFVLTTSKLVRLENTKLHCNRCSRKAHYFTVDKEGKLYYCAHHAKKAGKAVSFYMPLDCLQVIFSTMQEHDRVPLLFVCKAWKELVDRLKPTDLQRGRISCPALDFYFDYSSKFLRWAVKARVRGSPVALKKALSSPKYYKIAEKLLYKGYPCGCHADKIKGCDVLTEFVRMCDGDYLYELSIMGFFISHGCCIRKEVVIPPDIEHYYVQRM